jgi:hypothetical protein
VRQWEDDNQQFDDNYRRQRKEPTDCNALFNHAIAMGNKIFIPICKGLKGKLGELIIDNEHIPDYAGLPVDMLICSNSAALDKDDDFPIVDDNDCADCAAEEINCAYALFDLASASF